MILYIVRSVKSKEDNNQGLEIGLKIRLRISYKDRIRKVQNFYYYNN